MNYAAAKVYKIYSPTQPELGEYYGTTCQPLSKRMAQHRSDHKYNRSSTKAAAIVRAGDASIILVEACAGVTSKEELNAREAHWIRNNECVNRAVPGRTRAEYYAEHKEEIAAAVKAYCAEHKEEIAATRKAYRAEHKEEAEAYQAVYRAEHKEEAAATAAVHYADNREARLAKAQEYAAAHRVERAAYRAARKAETAEYNREYAAAHRVERNAQRRALRGAKKAAAAAAAAEAAV